MRKILSNIVGILNANMPTTVRPATPKIIGNSFMMFCGSVFTVMLFSLVAFARMNGWVAVAISGSIALPLAYVYGSLAKKLGVKMEF